jgi:hypothetical protein
MTKTSPIVAIENKRRHGICTGYPPNSAILSVRERSRATDALWAINDFERVTGCRAASVR